MADMQSLGEQAARQFWLWIWPKRDETGMRCFPWKRHMAILLLFLTIFSIGVALINQGWAKPYISGFLTTKQAEQFALKSDLKTVAETGDHTKVVVDFLVSDYLGGTIQEKIAQKCSAKDGYRDELNSEIAQLQTKYRRMFGAYYPARDDCSD